MISVWEEPGQNAFEILALTQMSNRRFKLLD